MKNVYLIDFRKERNLSPEVMADTIGVSKSYYEKVEYGVRNPSYGFASKLVRAFPEIRLELLYAHATCS